MKNGPQILVVLAAAFGMKMVLAKEEEENPAVTTMNVAMSGTLIASISFIMILYYFTNYPDDDIQKSSWDIVSSTISIFCAVLLFQSFNAVVEETIINPFFGEEEATPGALFVDMCHMLLWFTCLQLLLAKMSGAWDDDKLNIEFTKPRKGMSEKESKKLWDKRKEKQETVELDLKCFAVLMAHLTGFASINAWGTVQQFPFFKTTPMHAFLAVPLAICGQLILQRLTDTYRERSALGDDARKSWWEKKWDSEAEEAENDVMGLTVSFLTMNAIRSAISGCLPNQEGAEEECAVEEFLYHHTSPQKIMMGVLILISTALIFVVLFSVEMEEEEEEEEEPLGEDGKEEKKEEKEEEGGEKKEETNEVYARFKECMVVALSMLFSWAFFYGMQMWLAGIYELQGMEELLAVVLAMSVSLIGFALLVLLDKAADADSGKVIEMFHKNMPKKELKEKAEAFDEKVDRGIRQIMFAIGLAIGFAWEQCFDKSVDALAEVTKESKVFFINPSTMKIYLAIFCSALLVPAWRKYILPFVQAQGWQYGWTVNLVQKYCKESSEGEFENEDAKAKAMIKEKFEKHVAIIKGLVKFQLSTKEIAEEQKEGETMDATRERLIKLTYKTELALEEIGEQSHASSSGGNDAALEAEVKDLRSQLSSYRRMFDDHMKNMGTNLRKMNETMNKLQSA